MKVDYSKVETVNRNCEVRKFDGFRLWTLDGVYVIEYVSPYYGKANRARTYKTYGAMWKAWSSIVSGDTTYVNF